MVGGARCSSTEGLGELCPRELSVEDLPLRCKRARVGDDWPEFLELGLNRAVAGDADFPKKENPAVCPGGVARSCSELGRDVVGVLCEPDIDGEPLDMLKSGVCAVTEEFDPKDSAVAEWLFLRWDMGNKGSGCFGFLRRRKNVVVVCVVCVVVVVLP